MQQIGMVFGVKSEMVETYKRLHPAVWPDVLAQIKTSNIRNYTDLLCEPKNLLFGY